MRGCIESGSSEDISTTNAQAPSVSGEISSQQDVLVAIDRICRYYDRHEFSSPVPLLLRAAQRMVTKDYLEISSILTPDAVQLLARISGVESET